MVEDRPTLGHHIASSAKYRTSGAAGNISN